MKPSSATSPFPRIRGALAGLCLAALLCVSAFLPTACNLGGGTDVGNPDFSARISGSIKHRDGSPAALVPIHLRPKAFLSNPDSAPGQAGKAVQDGFSDTQGFFTLDSVPRGDYRIEAIDTSGRGAIMEVSQDGRSDLLTLAPVFIDTTGWISGKVIYRGPAQSPPPKIIIAVYGMDRWTAATIGGDFTLSGLPPGKYSLHISTMANTGLTTLISDVALDAGGRVSLETVDLGP